MFSLLIPAFNEEQVIEQTVRELHEILQQTVGGFEIIVIDDGSSDRTAAIVSAISLPNLRLLRHQKNYGYSSSLKTGIRSTQGEIIGIVDADGTYPLRDFPRLLDTMHRTKADMVVGARTKKGAKIPFIRRPAKAILKALARALTGLDIPDLNSGMRVFTRSLAERFFPLYPQRFSFTITITLAALTNGYNVQYIPIDYFSRTGKSSLSSGTNGIRNFIHFLLLIIRMVRYFHPRSPSSVHNLPPPPS
jgi:glycosyltransferase involved in cell wall biosynthesis